MTLETRDAELFAVECVQCGGEFIVERPDRHTGFCSIECIFEAAAESESRRGRPRQIVCKHCGELRDVKSRGPVPEYCSAACGVRHRKERAQAATPGPAMGASVEDTTNDMVGSQGSTEAPTISPSDLTGGKRDRSAITATTGEDGSTSDLQLIRRALREARPYRMRIALFFCLSLLSTPLALLTPVPLAVAIDSSVGSEPLPAFLRVLVPSSVEDSSKGVLILACVLLVLVAVLSALQSLATTVLEASTGEKLTLQFQSTLLQHVQRLSFAFHDTRGTADSIYRIQYDAKAVQSIAIRTLIPVVTALLTLLSMLAIIFRINTRLALVALAVSPFLFVYTRVYRHRMRPMYKQAKRLESSALTVVQEVLTTFRVVKAFGREDHEKQRFVRRGTEGVEARIGLSVGEGVFSLIVNGTTAVGTAVVLYVGVGAVQDRTLTVGALLVVLSYVAQLYGPLKTLSNRTASLQRQLASAERAFDLLDEMPDVDERPNATAIDRAKGEIEVRDVSFGYDRDVDVLKGLSLQIPAGSRVGIAGKTGAGKTTFVSLLARFYDPREGQILLDGIDLRDYRLKDLRAQFTIMLQEPVLFSTSVAENVAYARPGASLEEIVAATKMAGAHKFVSALPEGYETVVGERGMSLSGGERQRLSLARAFLYDAPILILDEPTSAVDVETEAEIMDAMDDLMVGRTTFMIAHRTSTLENCDQILTVDRGGIAVSDKQT